MKVLIAYYSMKGTTKRVAEALAGRLRCDIEEIRSVRSRKGLWGFVVSGFEVAFKQLGTIHPTKLDPAAYDLIIIGTPVWGNNMSSLTRTYLTQYRMKFKRVAFFCTCSSSGIESTFRNMGDLCGKEPVASLGLTADDFKKGSDMQISPRHIREIEVFVKQLGERKE